jgi:hypothetical protein
LTRRRTAACCIALSLLAGGCGDSTVDVFNPDVGVLAHWALDEGEAGDAVVDSSGFGLDGALSANPPVPSPDVPPVHFPDPYSLSFNGQDEYVVFGNPPILNLGGPISIAAWVRATSTDGFQDIVAHGYTPDQVQDLALRINSGSYEFTYFDFQAGMDHGAKVTIQPSDVGAWVHLCGVFDGNNYLVYRDGALAATTPDTTVPPANINALWAIGGRAPDSAAAVRFLAGELDDVRIYGRALSAAEVQALYQR